MPEDAKVAPEKRATRVERLALTLRPPEARLPGRLTTGEHARIRRMDVTGQAWPWLDIYRAWDLADLRVKVEAEDRWAILTHCLALTRGQHQRYNGGAFQDMGFGENHFATLLAADASVLPRLMSRLARWAGTKQAALDWNALGSLLVHAGCNPQAADDARKELARLYVRARRTHDETRETQKEGSGA